MDDLLSKIKVFLDHYAATHGSVRTASTNRINGAALAREMGVDKSTVSRLLRKVRNVQDEESAKPYSMDSSTQTGLMKLAHARTAAQLHDTLDRTYAQIHGIQGGKKHRAKRS